MSETCSKTILIVEDEPIWQTSLANLLARIGYETVAAFDESDVFVRLRDLKRLPILAIVDLQLVGSNQPEDLKAGYAVLHHLRKRGVYTMVLSAYVPRDEQFFVAHPEILDVVDKLRFTDPDFESFFLEKLQDAVAHAEAARFAEGKTEAQQNLI